MPYGFFFSPKVHLFVFVLEKTSGVGGIGLGNTVNINFCASCSYRYLKFPLFFFCLILAICLLLVVALCFLIGGSRLNYILRYHRI